MFCRCWSDADGCGDSHRMQGVTNRRLLLVHAHPDDESSQSSGTIAKYIDEGAQVTLVTCTLGERGEILVPEWEHYSPEELGRKRVAELEAACACMGLDDQVFLGGVGAYHDTGMAIDDDGKVVPPTDMPDNAFWKADLLEAANHLVKIIRDRRPQVLITYDAFGGYGHPDHIQAHRVAMYAMTLAASPSHEPELGPAWQVQRAVWGTYNTEAWRRALPQIREAGMIPEEFEEQFSAREQRMLSADDSRISAIVPIGEYATVCRNALGEHRSQVNIEDPFWKIHGFVQAIENGGEAYLYACGVPFPNPGTVSSDLFEGLDV